jgi:hypothetical protein
VADGASVVSARCRCEIDHPVFGKIMQLGVEPIMPIVDG